MVRGKWIATAFVIMYTVCVTAVLAQEKRVQKSDLPEAVQKTADQQAKGTVVRGYTREVENGAVEYEVETTRNGLLRDISIAPDGSILEIEDQVRLSSLQPSVREAILKKAAGGKITKIESITKQGKVVAYEAHILTGKKRSEAQVGPSGENLGHEE